METETSPPPTATAAPLSGKAPTFCATSAILGAMAAPLSGKPPNLCTKDRAHERRCADFVLQGRAYQHQGADLVREDLTMRRPCAPMLRK